MSCSHNGVRPDQPLGKVEFCASCSGACQFMMCRVIFVTSSTSTSSRSTLMVTLLP
jgi:hypothetical protein